MSQPSEYRKNADMCRQLAHASSRPDDRRTWLEIAQHWDWVAMEAERSPGASPKGDGG
jgi:hypothetical protein